MRRFDGHTVMVTGASSGIGLATVQRLAKEGAKVICASRTKEKLDEVIAQLPGKDHMAIAFDAANEEQVLYAGGILKTENIQLHGAVMCAGQHSLRPLLLSKAANFEQSFALNVLSAILCTKMSVRLAPKEGASIV